MRASVVSQPALDGPSSRPESLASVLAGLARRVTEGWLRREPDAFLALERLCALQVAAYGRRRGLRVRDELLDLSALTELSLFEFLENCRGPEGEAGPEASQVPRDADELLRLSDRVASRLTQRRARELRRRVDASGTALSSAHSSVAGAAGARVADGGRALQVATWVEQAAWICAGQYPSARALPAYLLQGVLGQHVPPPSSRALVHFKAVLDQQLARVERRSDPSDAALAGALRRHIAPGGRGRREVKQLVEHCRRMPFAVTPVPGYRGASSQPVARATRRADAGGGIPRHSTRDERTEPRAAPRGQLDRGGRAATPARARPCGAAG